MHFHTLPLWEGILALDFINNNFIKTDEISFHAYLWHLQGVKCLSWLMTLCVIVASGSDSRFEFGWNKNRRVSSIHFTFTLKLTPFIMWNNGITGIFYAFIWFGNHPLSSPASSFEGHGCPYPVCVRGGEHTLYRLQVRHRRQTTIHSHIGTI